VITVSNSSPLLNLAVIRQLYLLERLYGRVYIPEAVWEELSAIGSAQPWGAGLHALAWLERRAVGDRSLLDTLLLELDRGEAEAIALAMQMHADLLLVDERRGRTIASRLGLKSLGLLGVLIDAKRKGYIAAVKPLLDAVMAEAGFWVSRPPYARVLQEVGEQT